MAGFISCPVADADHREASPPTGIPFTEQAIRIASGYYVAGDKNGMYCGRVGNTLYFLSMQSNSHGFTWSNTTSYLVTFTCRASDNPVIFYTQSIGIPFGSFSVDITQFSSVEEMLTAFYDEVVNPGGGGGGGGGGAYVIHVSVTAENNEDANIEVAVNAYADGAEYIDVKAVAADDYITDPNDGGGISQPSTPEGTFDDTSDPVPIQPIPSIGAANIGLVTLFKPSFQQLQDLGSYLWTHLDDFIENLQKFFTNPMDYIIALNIFPCNPSTGANRAIKIGNWLTDISMPPVDSQWYEFNCGTVKINPYWGSALDYSPNTKISIMLPFIGSAVLNTDEIMGQTVGLVYRFDLLSGNCVAMLTVNGDIVYQFTGECAVPVPLTASDWSRVYSAIVGSVVAVGTGAVGAAGAMAAAGGATATLAQARAAEAAGFAGQSFAMINESSKGVRGVQQMRQDMIQASQMALQAGREASAVPTRVGRALRASRISNTINNVVGQVMGAKGQVSHSSSISGSAGMLGNRIPYMIVEYPHQSLADNYKHYVGYPSNMTKVLGTLSGYTECEQVIVQGIAATDSEIEEITEALKGGVYL